jgi:DNA-binding transcriptional LysR family regulator
MIGDESYHEHACLYDLRVPELTVTGMRVVHEVAARGSFTAAARALGYTQSAVSRQVNLTEQAAGTELFERLPRGVRPTAHGALLLRRIASILERIDSAMLEVEGLGATLTARLTLGAFPTALAALVPRALARVRTEHPAIRVKIHEGGTIAQLRRVRAGRTELAVIAAGGGLEYDLDDLQVDLLMHGAPRLIVSAKHRFAERGWVNVTELRDEAWIVGEAERSGPQFGPWPTLDHEVTIAHSIRDWTARLGLVAAGLGVAVIPSLLTPALPPGLRAITVEDPRPFRREVLVVTLPDRSPSTQVVIDALHHEASHLPQTP